MFELISLHTQHNITAGIAALQCRSVELSEIPLSVLIISLDCSSIEEVK
jgi:hypothetical protein